MTRFIVAVLEGGLVVGVLDGIAATALANFNGVAPLRAWQFVASGLMGPKAFQQGPRSAMLGLLMHFVIALGATSTFVVAAHFFPWLLASPVLAGAIFGALVFVVMRLIIKISATPKRKQKLSQVLTQVGIHIFVIGIPIAVITKHCLSPA